MKISWGLNGPDTCVIVPNTANGDFICKGHKKFVLILSVLFRHLQLDFHETFRSDFFYQKCKLCETLWGDFVVLKVLNRKVLPCLIRRILFHFSTILMMIFMMSFLMCRFDIALLFLVPLQWRHNERDGVSNYQPHDCLLNRLFRRRSKKTSKLHVTGLCAGNSPVTGEFPSQMASNA